MNSPIDILEKYATAFRGLVNDRVWDNDESIKNTLRLNDANDWNFVCVAMDVVGDASLALNDFLQFSLDGPTRYDEVGERYLRLYGVLSAAYIQQQAVLKLYYLMQCPSPKDIKAGFEKLEIRKLRHQLASHSLDYTEPQEKKAQAFVPVRVGLKGFNCTVTENSGDSSRVVKLDEAIIQHCKEVASVLDKIYEKSIQTFYKGQNKKIKEYVAKLNDLRFERDGNIIIRINNESGPSEIRLVYVEST